MKKLSLSIKGKFPLSLSDLRSLFKFKKRKKKRSGKGESFPFKKLNLLLLLILVGNAAVLSGFYFYKKKTIEREIDLIKFDIESQRKLHSTLNRKIKKIKEDYRNSRKGRSSKSIPSFVKQLGVILNKSDFAKVLSIEDVRPRDSDGNVVAIKKNGYEYYPVKMRLSAKNTRFAFVVMEAIKLHPLLNSINDIDCKKEEGKVLPIRCTVEMTFKRKISKEKKPKKG